ncbi:MAG: hypothetical protein RL376_426 [Verrucomicrobiota bacterium]|jgi:molybdenum cofactor cytidylyltransferase
MSCAILLLCAGASSRWGHPKALLPWGKYETLGSHLARIALDAALGPVVRVLGAHHRQITAAPSPIGLLNTLNPAWPEGMGGSIACGLHHALSIVSTLEAVIILPCDLPLVTPSLLTTLRDHLAGQPSRIVRCDYENGSFGPPVGFGRTYFPEVLALRGDTGGRSIIARHPEHVLDIPFADGRWDLDCAGDLERFRAATGPTLAAPL